MNKINYRMTDIHTHIIPCVDDGPASLETAMQMIHAAYMQGVRDIFCTSHSCGDYESYHKNFTILEHQIVASGMDLQLHHGCEIDGSAENAHDIIQAAHTGRYPALGNSDYILIEFDRDTSKIELLNTIYQYIENSNNHIVIAHIERLYCLYEDDTVLDLLQSLGCLFQLNAFSLVEESKEATRNFARRMVEQQRITFLGSDAHRMKHRPPNVASGIAYIYQHCAPDYADAICYKNAEKLLNVHPQLTN